MEPYRNINMVNLQYNRIQMEYPISPSQLINASFNIVDIVQYTAEIKTPFASEKIVYTAYHAILLMVI